jgi:peptidoglycan/LPS O-acetylase OafA/YrhL
MRVKSLDSVRGLASLIVVFSHCYLVCPRQADFASAITASGTWARSWTWLTCTPLGAFVNGRAAVMLFFVLSGMVLSFPFLAGNQICYERYVVRRVCRIYLPFAFAIFFSAVLYAAANPAPIPELGEWLNEKSWTSAPNWRLLAAHLLMTGRPTDTTLDNVIWSLVHELRISMIFPLLMLVALRSWRTLFVASAITSLIALAVVRLVPLHPLWSTALESAYYVVFFVAGIGLAMHSAAIKKRMAGLGAGRVAGLLAASTLAWAVPVGVPIAEFIYAAAAVAMLCLAMGVERVDNALRRSPLLWLGRVSYSLYLIHVPILLAFVHCLYGVAPLWLILPGAVATSLAGAELIYRAVEAPSIRLGHYLSARRLAQPIDGAFAPRMPQPAE